MIIKLSSLIFTLSSLGFHDESNDVIKITAALQRGKAGVDILAYARRIINMFFPSLAKSIIEIYDLAVKANEKLLEKEKKAKAIKEKYETLLKSLGFSSIEELEESTTTDEKMKSKIFKLEQQYFSLSDVYEPIKIVLKNKTLKYFIQFRKAKGDIYCEGNSIDNAALQEIKSVPLSSFVRKEEAKLLSFSASVFNIHIEKREQYLRTPKGEEIKNVIPSAVTFLNGKLAYNIKLKVDYHRPETIKESIQELYNEIVATIVHEMTHVQQGNLKTKVDDFLMDESDRDGHFYIDDERFYLLTDKGQILNKRDKIKKNINRSIMSEEEIDDLQQIADEPRTMPVTTGDPSFNIAMDTLLRFGKDAPVTGAKMLSELEQKINSKTLHIVDVYETRARYKDELEEEKNKKDVLGVGETYHKEKEKYSTDNKWFDYFKTPEEIEAWLRQMMSTAKLNKTNLAKEFARNTRTIAKGDVKDRLVAVWEEYKKMFAKLNYDKKYLGTDAEALGG